MFIWIHIHKYLLEISPGCRNSVIMFLCEYVSRNLFQKSYINSRLLFSLSFEHFLVMPRSTRSIDLFPCATTYIARKDCDKRQYLRLDAIIGFSFCNIPKSLALIHRSKCVYQSLACLFFGRCFLRTYYVLITILAYINGSSYKKFTIYIVIYVYRIHGKTMFVIHTPYVDIVRYRVYK